VEDSVYEDSRFRRQLQDAVTTLRPGPSSDRRTTIGPVIRPPTGPLLAGLTHLQSGEDWLVPPGQVGDNPRLWSPGVKVGVAAGSPFHLTECFGPVLGLMRASGLEEAIEWQNQVPYGLTAGLAALDPSEISYWREKVKAGNLYVNRHTTGAIVGRQPFGGWKRSVVGPGAKTGGPNYVASLGTWSRPGPHDVRVFAAAVSRAWNQELAASDPAGLDAESNVLRYRPFESVLLRIGGHSDDWEISATAAAAAALGVSLEISAGEQGMWRGPVTVETEARFAERLKQVEADKLRVLGEVGDAVRSAATAAGFWLDEGSPANDARAEALRWGREQCVTETRHRHGDVTSRRPGLRAARRSSQIHEQVGR
jgi:RHH-type transcriptional regulator, proline utilization regulon repressor / proline dehydrogenase / delta 1-pyrroline-5-carboxylate dehydrogenase